MEPTGDPELDGSDPAAAFGRLFDDHYPALRRYLARRVGEHVADDLAGEVFLIAYQRRRDYRPERAPVRAWLYGIASNLLRHHVRREVRHHLAAARIAAREGASVGGHDGAVADRVDAEVAVRALAAGLAALRPGDRDVLLLVSWAGLDQNEVAAALGIPVGTVRSRLHRVRRTLRQRETER